MGDREDWLITCVKSCREPLESSWGGRIDLWPGTLLLSGNAGHLLLNNLGISGIVLVLGPSKKKALLISILSISLMVVP